MISQAANRHALNVSLIVGGSGVMLLLLGSIVARQQVAISYLVAYTATLAVIVGMLLLVAIAHLSGAVWFVAFRPDAEAVISSLPMLGVFTLPLLIFPGTFWQWAASSGGLAPADINHGRLQPSYVIARALVYWGIWLSVGEVLLRLLRHSRSDQVTRRRRLGVVSAIAIPVVALTVTLAAFDWMMSLSPDWFSTVYGAYYSTGGLLSALALLAVMACRDRGAEGELTPTAEHFHAMSRLTLAFVLFWAYLWYAQFFIIWIGDVPREVTWYVARLQGGWRILARTVIVGGFVVPVITLLFRLAKRSSTVVGLIGWLLLVVHYLDVYWTIVPSVRPAWTIGCLLWDLGALMAIVGLPAALAIWRHGGARRITANDPLSQLSLRYQAH